jgi:hypothetical protein
MGFSFGSIRNPFTAEVGKVGAGLTGDPVLGFGASKIDPDVAEFLTDPLDLSGKRAREAQEGVNQLLLSSTRAGLEEQRGQLSELERLSAPFREAATETALPTLRALATGQGEVGFTPSKLFQLQKEQGTRGIRRRLAAQGKFGSSQRFEEEADLISQLARADVERFERGNLAQLQAGIGTTEALGAAGQTLGAAGGALLSNLGQQQNIAQQNLGAQRRASFESAASGISGLASLLNQ